MCYFNRRSFYLYTHSHVTQISRLLEQEHVEHEPYDPSQIHQHCGSIQQWQRPCKRELLSISRKSPTTTARTISRSLAEAVSLKRGDGKNWLLDFALTVSTLLQCHSILGGKCRASGLAANRSLHMHPKRNLVSSNAQHSHQQAGD
jgi:hypothetical protein